MGSKGGHALRVGRGTQCCRGAVAQHLCRVLSLPLASSQAPREETGSCPPLLKPFPPGLPCNSGVLEKEGLFNPFPPGASWFLTRQPQHTSSGLMLWPLGMPSASPLPSGSSSTILQSSFLLPPRVLRAILALGDGSCPRCHLPSLSQQLRLRCNKFVHSAARQPRAQQTPGGRCHQLHPCGERPSSLAGMALRVPAGHLMELRGWDQPLRSLGRAAGRDHGWYCCSNQPFSWKRERL